MPDFQYRARDAQGTAHNGHISAASKMIAVNRLRDRGWVVLAIQPASANPNERAAKFDVRLWLPIRSLHVEIGLQQLAVMLRSGMTLLNALGNVADYTSSLAMRAVWNDLSAGIQAGSPFHEALQQHRCFPEFVIRLVRVGEQTGNLDTVLDRAAVTLRDRRNSRESVVSATIYPVLIVTLAAAVTVYMVVYLIPRLADYLQSLGKDLPVMTQALVDGSFWLRNNILAIGMLLAAVVAFGWIVYASGEGRLLVDRLLLRVPLLGRLLRLSETATFARSLSLMLKSGVTLTEGLRAVENIVGNRHLRRTIAEARENIIRGGNLADAFNQKYAFMPMLAKMAAVGQETGELHPVLDEVVNLQESQFSSTVKRLNAILTPLLTILIGGVVGYVYIAFFVALLAASG